MPAALRAQKKTADSILAARKALDGLDLGVQERHLRRIASLITEMQAAIDALRELIADDDAGDDPVAATKVARDNFVPAMDALRDAADGLETLVADDLWPIPKYRELLTVH